MKPSTLINIFTAIVFVTASFFIFTKLAAAEPIILTPDVLTGEFIARVNTNTDDVRVTQVCLYRIDSHSPDTAAAFMCGLTADGREPTIDEATASAEGVIVDIHFTTVLVPGQNQEFVVRNLAQAVSGVIPSAPGPNVGIIPARPVSPVFIIIAPERMQHDE